MSWWMMEFFLVLQIIRSKGGHLHHALVDLTDPQI